MWLIHFLAFQYGFYVANMITHGTFVRFPWKSPRLCCFPGIYPPHSPQTQLEFTFPGKNQTQVISALWPQVSIYIWSKKDNDHLNGPWWMWFFVFVQILTLYFISYFSTGCFSFLQAWLSHQVTEASNSGDIYGFYHVVHPKLLHDFRSTFFPLALVNIFPTCLGNEGDWRILSIHKFRKGNAASGASVKFSFHIHITILQDKRRTY